MAVKFIQMQCPSCGANLEFEEGRNQAFCSYCGTKIMIHDDTKHEYVYRTVDEGKIAEEKNKLELAKLSIEESKREDKEFWKLMAFGAITFVVLGIILAIAL